MWKAVALALGVSLSVIVDIQCQENDESQLHNADDLNTDIVGLQRGLKQLKIQLNRVRTSLRDLQNERDKVEARDKSNPATFMCRLNVDRTGMNSDAFRMNSSLGSLEERVVKLEKQAKYSGPFGTHCTSPMDCPFHGSSCQCGSCECSLGYSYEKTTGGCVKRCERYGDTFVQRLDHGVDGCNTLRIFTLTGESCMEACREQTDFVCISAEYQPSSRKCHMCDKPWFDIDPEDRGTDDFGWILYYRNCAV